MKKLLAAFMIFKVAYWLVDLKLLFSARSIAYHNDVLVEWWKQPIFILYNSDSVVLATIFLICAAIASILVLLNFKYSRGLFFLLWIIVSNINNKVFCTLTGGDLLFQQLLFFATFLSTGHINGESAIAILNKAIHNTGVLALRLQLCVLYFMAGYTKMVDPDWISGNAISKIFRIYDYNIPLFYDFSASAFTTFLNYTVVFYQLLFPILVWIRSIKKCFLAIGIIQHLFIAFAFGLPTFGFIMVISYAIFYAPSFKTNQLT